LAVAILTPAHLKIGLVHHGDREFKAPLEVEQRSAMNMRNGFAGTIAILALIFALAYQRSPQVVVVHAATRQSHE
jgi:hypothetical protein